MGLLPQKPQQWGVRTQENPRDNAGQQNTPGSVDCPRRRRGSSRRLTYKNARVSAEVLLEFLRMPPHAISNTRPDAFRKSRWQARLDTLQHFIHARHHGRHSIPDTLPARRNKSTPVRRLDLAQPVVRALPPHSHGELGPLVGQLIRADSTSYNGARWKRPARRCWIEKFFACPSVAASNQNASCVSAKVERSSSACSLLASTARQSRTEGPPSFSYFRSGAMPRAWQKSSCGIRATHTPWVGWDSRHCDAAHGKRPRRCDRVRGAGVGLQRGKLHVRQR